MTDELEGLESSGSGGGETEGAPAWMATFADMATLLLTFFVLLLSFANMDIVKFREMLGSVKEAFGVQTQVPGEYQGRATSPVELSEKISSDRLQVLDLPARPPPPAGPSRMDRRMASEIRGVVQQQQLEKVVEVETSARGVTLRVKGQLLFDPGSAELRPEAFVFLNELIELAKRFPYRISIEGHTDDLPIHSPVYPTNWHLSAARAIAALRYFIEVGHIDPHRLSCAGYADTRPLVPNDSPEHRAMNRRVEFVFQRDEGGEPSARRTPSSAAILPAPEP